MISCCNTASGMLFNLVIISDMIIVHAYRLESKPDTKNSFM